MNTISLLYHDAFEGTDRDQSGFPGAPAGRYKLPLDHFTRHIRALDARVGKPIRITDEPAEGWALTFDDGGLSACTLIAPVLAEVDFLGHFFITCDRVGTPTFANADQVRELDAAGHVVGSHSCSHPTRMAMCSREQLYDEWSRSRDVLSTMLGHDVTVASVPGGFYSRAVAEEASRAGIRTLFTSEPVARSWTVDACRVFGRYNILDRTPADEAAAIAAGARSPRWRQHLEWTAKKMFKRIGGQGYQRVRRTLLLRK